MTYKRTAAHDWLAREIIQTPTFPILPPKEREFLERAGDFKKLSPAQWKWLADIAAKVQGFGYLQEDHPDGE
jgi:hypothetical protein